MKVYLTFLLVGEGGGGGCFSDERGFILKLGGCPMRASVLMRGVSKKIVGWEGLPLMSRLYYGKPSLSAGGLGLQTNFQKLGP